MIRAILGGALLALTALFFAVAMRTQGSYDTYRDLWYAVSISELLALVAQTDAYSVFHCADCDGTASRWSVGYKGAERGVNVVEFSCT